MWRCTDKVFLGVRFPHPLGDAADPFPLFEKLDAFPSLYGGLDKVLLPSEGIVGGGGGGGGHVGRVIGKHREGKGVVSDLSFIAPTLRGV